MHNALNESTNGGGKKAGSENVNVTGDLNNPARTAPASNNRPNKNRLGVCITGQLSRLELATKIDRLLKPARAQGWDAIDLVMVSVSLSSLLACLHALHSLTHAVVGFFSPYTMYSLPNMSIHTAANFAYASR